MTKVLNFQQIILLKIKFKKKKSIQNLLRRIKKYIAQNDINFYIIDATALAEEIGLGGRTNMIMQTAFFKLAEVINFNDAVKFLKDEVIKKYIAKMILKTLKTFFFVI